MRAPRTTGDVPAPHRRPSLLATRTDDDDDDDEKEEEEEGKKGVTTTARGLMAVMLGGPSLLLLCEEVCSTRTFGKKKGKDNFCGKTDRPVSN